MNQTFSLLRFGRLLRKYGQDNSQTLLLNAGALLLIMVMAAVLIVYPDLPGRAKTVRSVMFLVGLWLFWTLFIVQQVTEYNSRKRTISALLLPASTLEKMVLLWLVTGIGFLVIYLTFFFSIDAVGTYYVNHRNWSVEQLASIRQINEPLRIDPFAIADVQEIWFAAITLLLHGVVLACGLLFRRYTLALTILTSIGLVAGAFFLHRFILHSLVDTAAIRITTRLPFDGIRVSLGQSGQDRRIDLPQPLGNYLRWGVGAASVVLLYLTSYFKLKEREV